MLERIERDHLPGGKRLLPVSLAQEQALWRHGMIRRRAEGLALERLRARIVMVGDLLEPLLACVVDQRIETDHCARQIIEQRREAVVEQRQPMLHALMLSPGRDQLVERVVAGDGTEQLDITLTEGTSHLRRQRHLAHRQQLHLLAPRLGALRLGVEGPDQFERVAEEVEAHRLAAGRIEVEDAAAHGVLAGIHHRPSARIARRFELLDQRLHGGDVAGMELHARSGDEVAGRHALKRGMDRGQHHERLLRIGRAIDQSGKGRDALGNRLGIGRDAVVGNAVPGGEAQHLHVGGEERDRLFERGEPVRVACHMQDRAAIRGMARELGEEERIEPFRHA